MIQFVIVSIDLDFESSIDLKFQVPTGVDTWQQFLQWLAHGRLPTMIVTCIVVWLKPRFASLP